jgi:hypothetical protein
MRRAFAIAILLWLPLSAARADVFRSVDAQGHVQYSDTPTPGAQLVHMNNQRMPIKSFASPAASTSGNAGSSSKPTTLAQASNQVHQQLEQEADARAVQKDVAQTRAEQCKQARDTYDQSIQARRLYKTGANGEREYLSDEDAEKARVASKQAMESACKGVP